MTRTAAMASAALAAALVLSACTGSPEAAAPTAPAPTATATPTPAVDVPIAAATPTPVRLPVPPVRVVVASLAIDVRVIDVGVGLGGFMQLPVDPAVGGWYRYGADPSSADGNTVISAHVDAPDYPIGPFSRIRELSPGERIEVTDAAGTVHRYSVATVASYPKASLPVDELFARAGTRALVLITCGGAFDSRSGRYADNVVAIATPMD